MLLALLDNPLLALPCRAVWRLVLTVEQVVGRRWEGSSDPGNVVSHLEDGLAKALIDHDGTQVEVIVRSSRPMNNDGSSNTTAILSQGVRVIPSGAVGRRMPLVDSGSAWRNAALSDTWNTVLIVGAILSDTVPMDGCGIIRQCVEHGDLDDISPVGHNGLAR